MTTLTRSYALALMFLVAIAERRFRMGNYGVGNIDKWKFDEPELPEEWTNHLGNLALPFRMIIEGDAGHGKTEYVFQLSKMLAMNLGKVHINNVEQGKAKSLKEAFDRQQMNEIAPGKWMLGDKSLRKFDAYVSKSEKQNSGKFLIIDSISYWELTYEQIKRLHELFLERA